MDAQWTRRIARLVARALEASIQDLESGRVSAVRLLLARETWLPSAEELPLGEERVRTTRRLCGEAARILEDAGADPRAAVPLLRRARTLWVDQASGPA